jgi:hypothetical protein
LENNYKEKILETLEKTAQPLDINKIRIAAGIGNWNTALKHCLELMLNKKIDGQKTSKSWVFWCKNKQVEPFNTFEKTEKVEA